jgi:hypothetical protein
MDRSRQQSGVMAAKTNKELYGEDFYRKIGALGGRKRATKGFALMGKEKLKQVSSRGGKISRRPGAR